MLPIDLDAFLERWEAPVPQAIALLGSYARGDAGIFSDVDLLFLVSAGAPPAARTSFLVDQFLVTVNAVSTQQIEVSFAEPEQAVNVVASLRQAVILQDPQNLLAAVQSRAHTFTWTNELQAKADRYASREMVGWSEEAHKGLDGLRRDDTGRLLNARFGLSWGLAGVMRVQRGVLSHSDNHFFDDVRAAVGERSRWSALLPLAFGVETADTHLFSLHEEVVAGLRLYCETAHLLAAVLQPQDQPLIEATVAQIEQELGDLSLF